MAEENLADKMIEELKLEAEDKIKHMGLPILHQPKLDDLLFPDELATETDELIDGLYDKFTLALQWSHYCEELIGAELDIATYKQELNMNLKMAQSVEKRKDLMVAKIVTDDKPTRDWNDIMKTLKVQGKLIKGLSKGYQSVVRRIQSEKIDRASRRKFGIL